jgi:lipid-binding SYLF domain-containing protein
MDFVRRLSQEATNALQDAYGTLVLGDDAGKSVRLVLVLHPTTSNLSNLSTLSTLSSKQPVVVQSLILGMTFLEVNGRAYVHTVQPESEAAKAGVLPRDAVQYAAVVSSSEWKGVEKRNNNTNNNTNTNKEWAKVASQLALQSETDGQRISYDELRRVLAEGMDTKRSRSQQPPPGATLSSSSYSRATRNPHSPNGYNAEIPSTINVEDGGSGIGIGIHSNPSPHGYGKPHSPSSSLRKPNQPVPNHPHPVPVVFVFRRTRQRSSSMAHLGLIPGMLPSWRMDDECDFASSLVQRLAPTKDNMLVPNPDAWDEFVHDGTDFLLGMTSILPPNHKNGPQQGNSTSGANEYANATTAPPQTFPSTPNTAVSGSIPFDDFEQERSKKLAMLRSRMALEAMGRMNNNSEEDVEAATIRGMIQKAVGLAFVRASKVVLGVSLHAGSGVVIARLGDGTWSAPSAIGTWGLGLGLQFGLEVAEYIFILQTQESLEHFMRGGSFTVGGNVGAAVAGMGREAYGAASVGGGICGADAASLDFYNNKEDEYNDQSSSQQDSLRKNGTSRIGIAPIVAYAKSQGLYIGVSLEGSSIFTRDEINCRTYKFSAGRDVSAHDILSGKVPTPPEAEDLYAALHSVEFTHEMSCLPRPPEILREDSSNSWYSNANTLGIITATKANAKANTPTNAIANTKTTIPPSVKDPFSFLKNMSVEDSEECSQFETQFKKFLYGGVSVQRLVPLQTSRSGRTRRERRTLWLMLPEVGSLRLGFVSKLSDEEGMMSITNKSSTAARIRQTEVVDARNILDGNNDLGTVASEEVTLDSALVDKVSKFLNFVCLFACLNFACGYGFVHQSDFLFYYYLLLFIKDNTSTFGQIRTGNVELSGKHSVALTDVTLLSHDPLVPIKFKREDQTEHLRVISIKDVSGTTILFLANNFREAELLLCGLKLLLERETSRLGVRGGVSLPSVGGRSPAQGGMSPAAARGFNDKSTPASESSSVHRKRGGKTSKGGGTARQSGYSSSEVDDDMDESNDNMDESIGDVSYPNAASVPEGWKSWGRVPGRSYMRGQAASYDSTGNVDEGVPKYVHGQLLVREIAKNVNLPLPLPLCRVLLLDSSSPVISKWEQDRGDVNFETTPWTFPPATPREMEHYQSEHQLIASGSMCGAHRTTSFERSRTGTVVRLSETQIIERDDSEQLAFTVNERMPRRGFSIKVKILLRSYNKNSCEATVLGEIRPVGKNMSNQAAVHKAFMLVVDELMARYGKDGVGLLEGFLNVVNSMPAESETEKSNAKSSKSLLRPFRRTSPTVNEEKKESDTTKTPAKSGESGLVSFEDMLKTTTKIPGDPEPYNTMDRPATPSVHLQVPAASKGIKSRPLSLNTDIFEDLDNDELGQPVLVEVKPLPKIRLSLMPSPREEDENDDSSRDVPQKVTKKKKKSSNRQQAKSSSWNKNNRSRN